MVLRQIPGGLDLHPAGIAGVVLQGYVLYVDDLHGLSDGAGLHRQLHSVAPILFS